MKMGSVKMIATIRLEGDPDEVQDRVHKMTDINNQVSDEQRRLQIRKDLIRELAASGGRME